METLDGKANFKNDKREGEAIDYYENGNIKWKRNYKNGKREGEAIYYDENGNIKEKRKL